MDKTSDAYRYGGYAGQAVSIALMAVTPVGWAKVAARGLNMVTTLGGGVQAAKAAAEGDFEAAGKLLVQTAVGRLAGRGAPCNAFTQAGKRAQKALWAANTVEQSSGAVEKLASGDIIGGLLDLAQAGVSARRMLQSCFTAGTPLLVPGGSKAIEEFVAGDVVLSRDESDPSGLVEAKVVEEVFARTGQIIHLHVGGQVIGTTAEHPFYAYDRGWVRAADLAAGDRLLSHDGRRTTVEEVYDTGEYATLYNLRVADWHTYFVGSAKWGWNVWAHNACVVLPSGKHLGEYGSLRSAGIKDGHHVIQNAAVRDLPGYSRRKAPAIELPGPSTTVGSSHYIATRVQDQSGGRTYASERRIGYKAMRRAGVSEAEARQAIKEADDYFIKGLGLSMSSVLPIPGNR